MERVSGMKKMRDDRTSIWTKPIKLSELKEGDIIHIRKSKGGFHIFIECEFIKYEKGLVYAKSIRKPDPEWYEVDFPIGSTLKARPSKTFLWGKGEDDRWERCHWCKDGVYE